MPNSRRPTQTRVRQQQQEYFRCAQCGPDPKAFRGATDHGLMLRMVQKLSGLQLIHESVAQLRQLDRTACVFCDTVRSRWCHRCSHCKGDTPQDFVVGDTFQDRRRLGHQNAAPVGSPTAHQPPRGSQPVPPGDPFDGGPLPNCTFRDIPFTDRDKQQLADLRRASAMAIPRCIGVGGEP